MAQITFDENGFASADGFLDTYNTDEFDVYVGVQQTQINKGFGLPSRAYLDAPTVIAKTNEAIVRKDNIWTIAPDLRGQTYYKKDTGEAITISKVGLVADDLTDKARPDQFHMWEAKKNDWVLNKSLKQDFITAQNTDQKALLKADAEERITLLERKVKLKRATEQDLTMLDLLYGFTLDLDELDLTKENIEWPTKPE